METSLSLVRHFHGNNTTIFSFLFERERSVGGLPVGCRGREGCQWRPVKGCQRRLKRKSGLQMGLWVDEDDG